MGLPIAASAVVASAGKRPNLGTRMISMKRIIIVTNALILDLASLVRRLSYALKRAGNNDELVRQSVDFLERYNLGGSILRELESTLTPKPWFSTNKEAIRWLRDEARQWHDDNPAVAAHLVEAAMMFEKKEKP